MTGELTFDLAMSNRQIPGLSTVMLLQVIAVLRFVRQVLEMIRAADPIVDLRIPTVQTSSAMNCHINALQANRRGLMSTGN
ncbi:MAG: hypothetical protein GY761_00635 [Hyphomicrobiales bacterium]|nr:hypothetical protein [Hyphomicrobiales bacterium]